MAEIIVTSTADSGAGSLRAAIDAAQDGDVILFDPVVFPIGQTTTIYLSSYLSVNKSIGIYGGSSDGNGGYTSGAKITRYVVRTVNDVETEVVVDDNRPALEGETVLFHATTRVALDGQATQAANAADEWTGWTGTKIASIAHGLYEVAIFGITFQNGLSTTSEVAPLVMFTGDAVPTDNQFKVVDCAFIGGVNSNNYAGGISPRGSSQPVFDRCEFRGCRSKGPAGAIYSVNNSAPTFNDCSFVGCSGTSGSVLYGHLTSLNTFNDCSFYGNSASSGTLHLTSNSVNVFNNCVFDSCSATSNGGVIYAISFSDNTFVDCKIQNCSAANGGSWQLAGISTNTITRCEIVGCSATTNAGVGYFTGSSQSTIEDCRFADCSARYGGGFYPFHATQTVFRRCEISNCSAESAGAFYCNGTSITTLIDCEIKDCVGTGSSGAGGFYGYCASTIVLKGTTVRNTGGVGPGYGAGAVSLVGSSRLIAGDSESGNKTRFIDCYNNSNQHDDWSAIRDTSLIYSNLDNIVFENCSASSVYPLESRTVRYFTTNADSGEGSFRAIVAACAYGDTVRPDPTIFPAGTTIDIKLSSAVQSTKPLFIEGYGRRIVLDGQGACACYETQFSTSFSDCELLNGYKPDARSCSIDITANGTGIFLTRCRIAGCKGYRLLNGLGSDGGYWVSSIIEGNYVTNALAPSFGPVCVGTVVAGNYGTGATVPNSRNVNSIFSGQQYTREFVASPPTSLTEANWNADLWKSWNLTLADDSQYKSGAETLDEIDALVAGDGAKCDIEGCPRKPSGSLGAYEDRTGIQLVTTTADSGAGSLRQAIADAAVGDVILFSYVTFPKDDTTVIPLNSNLTVSKSVDIYGGYWDADAEEYTSGATIARYVVREIEGVETEVVVGDDNPALEGEVVLMHVTTRVALDGQATQDPNHTGDFDGWTGTAVLYVAAPTDGECISTISGITGQNGLRASSERGSVLEVKEWTNATLDATFVDCAFLHGVNTSGIAGLVSVGGAGQSPHVRFTRCEFRDGRSNGGGGCAYVRDDSVVTFDDCSFVDGFSNSYGGGFYAQTRSITTFTDCAFWKCVASNTGGICTLNNEAQVTLTRCVLAKGSANSGGGIHTNHTVSATLNNCVVRDCTCVNNGGAFYLYANSSVTANNCVIDGCSAKYGGGEYSNNSSVFTATECTFSNCSATTNGGAICVYSPITHVFDSCVFTGNSCVSAGGAVVSYSRSVLEFNDCEFSNNTASSGGVFAAYNYSQNVLVNCDFGHNTANSGGSLYFTNYSRNVLRNCVVHDGSILSETGGGGVITCTNTPHNEYYSCEFRDCTANNAGVMYANGDSSNRFVDCSFTDISSSNVGGALYCINNTLTVLDDCTFLQCTSPYGGVAQICGSSRFYVRGATAFEQCEATGGGGALRSMGAVKLEIDDTVSFVDCAAPQGSAVLATSLYQVVTNATTVNCEIVNADNPANAQTRYFTTTADSGDGSLRAVIAACNNGDTIEPDPTVFPKGSDITIPLSSYLLFNKRVYLRGAGRRIVLDGQETTNVLRVTNAFALDAEDVSIVNGYNLSNFGAAAYVQDNSGMVLRRAIVAGNYGYRPLYANAAGGCMLISSVVTGNYATNAWPGMILMPVGSVVSGNYLNGTHGTSSFYGVGSVVATPSSAGFRVASPDTLAAEDWDKDLWKQWDLSLTDDSQYATSTAEDWEDADLWADGDDWRYDLVGFPRRTNGSLGAYETHVGAQFVYNTNDSGEGSLRKAIADAKSGESIYFSVATFPKGDTTVIPITSQIATSKSLRIDAENAEVYWVVRREVNGETVEVELADKNDAQDGEFPVKRLRCRVAIDGQNTTPCLRISPSHDDAWCYLRGIAFQNGLNSAEGGGGFRFATSYENADAQFVDCAVIHCQRQSACGGVYLYLTKDTSSATFSNCVFLNCETGSHGGGLYCDANTKASLNDCSFEGCSATSYGGAVYGLATCSMTFDDCVFAYNTAGSGSIYLANNVEATLRGCAFYANSTNVGGALCAISNVVITAEDCSFIDCQATAYGGAFRVSNTTTLTIVDSSFDGCVAQTGVSIYLSETARLTAEGCSFANSTSSTGGGTIYCTNSTSIEISDCSFTDLTTTNGGSALKAAGSANVTVEDCSFTRCIVLSSSSGSGAVYFSDTAQGSISGCSFNDCSATNYGSTVFANLYSTISIDDCSFVGCHCDGSGGVLYTSQNVELTVNNCSFTGCYGNLGAVLRANNIAKTTFTDCAFTECYANTDGGAAYLSSCTDTLFDNCTFTSCTAADEAGAIYALSDAVTTINDCTFTDCQAANGGAITLRYAVKTLLTGANVFTNCVSSVIGSALYDRSMFSPEGLATATFENCEYVAERTPEQQQVRYFTTTADSGDGSLRSVIASANEYDIIQPDPNVFPKGSIIHIPLTSYLLFVKQMFLDANGRRIVLDGQGECKIAQTNSALVANDVDFINGYDSTNTGAALTLYGNASAWLTRCLVAGTKSYRLLYTSSAGGLVANACVVTGNYATNSWPGCTIKVIGSTVEGNYLNGAATRTVSSYESVNSIAEFLPSEVGFKIAPPDTIAEEDWDKDLWREWNLALTPQSEYASGYDFAERDERWEPDEDAFLLDFNGYERSANGERGAFATSDVDLYWTGYDENGDAVAEPSFDDAAGWSVSPVFYMASDRVPTSSDSVILRGATFTGTLAASSVYLSGDLDITATFSDECAINVERFNYTGSLTASGTVVFDGAIDDLTLTTDGTLVVSGDTTIKNLTLEDGATVSFSNAETTLTVSETADVGAATLTCDSQNAYFNVPNGTDLTQATFYNVSAAVSGTQVLSVSGTKIGKNYTIFIKTLGNSSAVSVEYKALDDSSWTIAQSAFVGSTYTTRLDGDYEFRVYDGETFHNAVIKVFGLYHEMAAKVEIGYLI